MTPELAERLVEAVESLRSCAWWYFGIFVACAILAWIFGREK